MMLRHPLSLPIQRRIFVNTLVAAGLLALFVGSALAQQVGNGQAVAGTTTLQAIGTETGTWSSNPLLIVGGAPSLMGSTTSPELLFKRTTPLSQINIDTKIDENVFNQKAFDSTDLHLSADLSKRNARWTAGLQERTDYDTTRTSELTNYGFSGFVARHMGLSLTPQVSFNPTAVDSFALTGSAALSQYDNAAFINYANYTATPSYTHRFDQQNAGIILVQAQHYQTMRADPVDVDSVGPSIGWQTTFSPRITANASVGAQASRQYGLGTQGSPWAWSYIFAGGLAFTGTQDILNLKTQRAQFPYGNGTEALQTSFSFNESHALNSKISLNCGANYATSSYQVATIGNLKELMGGSLGVAYHATEQLDFTTAYLYRHETLTNIVETAQDHAITVNLAYRPNMWTLLR